MASRSMCHDRHSGVKHFLARAGQTASMGEGERRVPADRDGPRQQDELAALRLARAATGRRGLAVRRLGGGCANATLAVSFDRLAPVVVRIYERAPEVAATEAAVLARAASACPVPGVLMADAAGHVMGRPALVLEHVDGVLASRVLAAADPDEALAVGRALGAALAPLGTIGFDRSGFFGGPELEPGGMVGNVDAQLADAVNAALSGLGRDLDPDLTASWRALVAATAPATDQLTGPALVHADFNPKNLLLRRGPDGWAVAAVLDWEFAFAGSPLADLGNLQRFAHEQPPGYATAVGEGFAAAGGELPTGWREAAAALDVFALCDFIQRGPGAPFFAATVDIMRTAVTRGSLVLTDG